MTKTSLLNRAPRAILSSPLHPLMSKKRLVLCWSGRRTGTPYATPVNYLQRGRELLITTDSGWWQNFEQPTPVTLRLRGHRVHGTALAVRDPELAAEGLAALIADHPPYGRWAHVRVIDGIPDPDEVRAEIARGRVRVELSDQGGGA
ncbi:MAG: nitroreductase family deazaflavin-dependent oxidoreductase [Solirubrobacterales bacterium]|nr:nitroreductase family deazaflavin-dependent oxidoreductase [Solirubrobacterales bacterium]